MFTTCLNLLPGIDYTNPFLGGAFGPGNKVIGGFDFVGDAYGELDRSVRSIALISETDGTNTPIPDDDPLDTCNGHGTHVGVRVSYKALTFLSVSHYDRASLALTPLTRSTSAVLRTRRR